MENEKDEPTAGFLTILKLFVILWLLVFFHPITNEELENMRFYP